MAFVKENLPGAEEFFTSRGLVLTGPSRAKWRTTRCEFHGGSDSMRVNMTTGGWCCMACEAKGGDVLAYLMASDGLPFVEAAKQLGAWVDDPNKPFQRSRPTPFPAKDALQILSMESFLIALIGADLAKGRVLSEVDRERLNRAVSRVQAISGAFA